MGGQRTRKRLVTPSWWWWAVTPVIAAAAYALSAWLLPALTRGFASGSENLAARSFWNTAESFFVAFARYAPFLGALAWILFIRRRAIDARRLDRQTGIDSIRRLKWQEFELLLGEAFRRQGHRVTVTGPGADGGVDLILHGKDGRTIVQAKQWNVNKVGVAKVRELLGVQTAQKASGAILVTSGRVTDEARRFAQANGIRLIEGDELERMIREVQWQLPTENPRAQQAETTPIDCPVCGSPMVRRTALRGDKAGQDFLGCSTYPRCRGTRDIP